MRKIKHKQNYKNKSTLPPFLKNIKKGVIASKKNAPNGVHPVFEQILKSFSLYEENAKK